MSVSWVFRQVTPVGATGQVYTDENPGGIMDFTWSLSPTGSCLDLSFTAVPNLVAFEPRDLLEVTLQIDGGLIQAVFYGVIMAAGDVRGAEPVEYRVAGLYRRLEEIVVPNDVVDGADVATMIDDVVGNLDRPVGFDPDPVTGANPSVDAPTLSFELGDRYPAFETVNEFLDAMRDATGAFIVPTGSSYTYDGTTYNAGDTVPATAWGVNADREFYFRRPQAAVVQLDVRTDAVSLEWDRISGEQVWDHVALIYAAEIADGDTFKYVAPGGGIVPWTRGTPIARTFGTGAINATRVVPLSASLDYMTDVAAPDVNLTWTDPWDAFDNDLATFAQASTAGSNELTAVATGYQEAVARVDFAKALDDDLFSVQLYWYDGVDTLATIFYDFKGENTTERQIVLLPALKPAGVDVSSADLYARVLANENAKVYRLELMVPDEDEGGTASSKLAQGYMRDPEPAGGRVSLYGLGDVSQDLELTLHDGSTVDLPIRRIEYTVTREDGLVTTYHVGEDEDVDLIAERVVLERIAERSQ